MPIHEKFSATNNSETSGLEYHQQVKLKKLNMLAHSFVMAGLTSGLGIVLGLGVKYGVEKTATMNTETQQTHIKEKFGPWYRTNADSIPDQEPETEATLHTLTNTIPTNEGKINNMVLGRILQETMPVGWVNNELERVEYEEAEKYIEYEGVNNTAVASCYRMGRTRNKKKDEVIFHAGAKRESVKFIFETLYHEVAHANDWESDNEMTASEKAALALKIAERLTADDRFRSSYVESINWPDDPKKTRYYRAIEYWAVICAQYHTDATKLNTKDFQLVDNHVRKTDTKFSWITANARRHEILRQASLEQTPLPETVQTGQDEITLNPTTQQ